MIPYTGKTGKNRIGRNRMGVVCFVLMFLLVGCTKETTLNNQEKIESYASESESTINNLKKNKANNTDKTDNTDNTDNTDILDLTVMNGDMVYATVYQFMVSPEDYIGRTVKITGTYRSEFYEPTNQTYHYVLITDAMACCSQGIEFVFDDDQTYPNEEEDITIMGTFETYEEEGKLYCRLADASICQK